MNRNTPFPEKNYNTEAEAVARIAAKPQVIRDGDRSFLLLPSEGGGWNYMELNSMPGYINETYTAYKFSSFIDYVKRFKKENTIIGFDAAIFKAIIDYHGQDSQDVGRCLHTASFRPSYSPEFRPWWEIEDCLLDQEDFVEFLEENLRRVVNPDQSELFEVCRNIEAVKTVEFKSSVRLSTGTRTINYSEDQKGNGQLKVPELITIHVPVYDELDFQDISFRLYWPIRNGELKFKIKMLDKNRVFETAQKSFVDQIRIELPDIPFYHGNRVLAPHRGNTGE